jgi:hypothetical protein
MPADLAGFEYDELYELWDGLEQLIDRGIDTALTYRVRTKLALVLLHWLDTHPLQKADPSDVNHWRSLLAWEVADAR